MKLLIRSLLQMLVLQSKCRLEQERIDRLEEAYTMELIVAHQTKTQISVICDGSLSHSFDLRPLLLKYEKILIDNPVLYHSKTLQGVVPV
jgi:hypothetical protein